MKTLLTRITGYGRPEDSDEYDALALEEQLATSPKINNDEKADTYSAILSTLREKLIMWHCWLIKNIPNFRTQWQKLIKCSRKLTPNLLLLLPLTPDHAPPFIVFLVGCQAMFHPDAMDV